MSLRARIETELDARVDPAYRSAFYCLPLLMQWIAGIAIESREGTSRAARRGMGLFLLFLGVLSLSYVANGFIRYFSETADLISGYIFFVIHTLNIIVYLVLSLLLVAGELRKSERVQKANILDRFMARFEARLSE